MNIVILHYHSSNSKNTYVEFDILEIIVVNSSIKEAFDNFQKKRKNWQKISKYCFINIEKRLNFANVNFKFIVKLKKCMLILSD